MGGVRRPFRGRQGSGTHGRRARHPFRGGQPRGTDGGGKFAPEFGSPAIRGRNPPRTYGRPPAQCQRPRDRALHCGQSTEEERSSSAPRNQGPRNGEVSCRTPKEGKKAAARPERSCNGVLTIPIVRNQVLPEEEHQLAGAMRQRRAKAEDEGGARGLDNVGTPGSREPLENDPAAGRKHHAGTHGCNDEQAPQKRANLRYE